MLSKLYKQFISWSMLVIVALGSTASVIGEFRSHSLLSLSPAVYHKDAGHQSNVGHHHHSGHQHAIDHHAVGELNQTDEGSEFVSHHDASNHHHDKGHLKPDLFIADSQLLSIVRDRRVSGEPSYSPFLLDRPPITSIFV